MLVLLSSLVISGCGLAKEEAKTPPPLSNKEFQAASLDQEVYQNAISLLNEKLCESIKDKDLKTNCAIMIQDKKLLNSLIAKSENTSDCKKIKTDELKSICETQLQQKIDTAKLNEKTQQDLQKNNDLLNKILQTGDITKCKEFNDEFWQNLCQSDIQQPSKKTNN